MIPALTCLLLPFMGVCPDYVRYVPAIAAVVQNQARYTGRIVRVTGRVRKLDQWNSRSGEPEESFFVCSTGCIRVYMRVHSSIRNGELVTVNGPYYQAYRAGRSTYYNEIEGTGLLPRE